MVEGRQHYNVTLGILTLAGIAFALQQTMVIPALPALQRELHTTTTWVTWVLTVFLLVASVATPILGKLGDQYGKERLLAITLGIFLVGCIGAAASWNIWVLISFRALQGVGGAIFPLSFSIIRDEFPREKVGVAIGARAGVGRRGGSSACSRPRPSCSSHGGGQSSPWPSRWSTCGCSHAGRCCSQT